MSETEIVATSTSTQHTLALLPLKNVVILPKSIIPIIVGRQSSIQAVEYALKHNQTLFISAQKDSRVENPTADDVFTYGTRSSILQVMRMPNGSLKLLAEGICRTRIISSQEVDGFIEVACEDIPTTSVEENVEVEAIWRKLKTLYASYAQLKENVPADLITMVKTPQDMDYISDTIAVQIRNLSFNDRQKLLETVDLQERMILLCAFLSKEIEILETEQRISGRIQTQVEKSQKEYYLTEKMKAIQKELGRDDQSAEIAQIRTKIKTLGLTKEATEKVEKELRKLEQMPPLSSEAVVSRNYVDWIISLPWKKFSKDAISLTHAEEILSQNHAGLHKAKDRIIEFLAAKKFSKVLTRSPIICLVGPPGVGKTSLAASIAKSLGREFQRISLGGVKDEAEIRGHRRTYIGALPGKILQAMKRAKTVNPVILLDEIDKMGRDMHGDPAAALLEVLDPEQNKTFVDHYLDIEYDLSKVMFIATANMLEGIPYPLFDRMEIISLSGYTEDEKVAIAQQFLIPKSLEEYGLTGAQFKIGGHELRIIINDYTKESGVRQLERTLAKLMRKSIQLILKDKNLNEIVITDKLIKEWLGNPKFKKTSLSLKKERIGLATGLAWTEVGGDVLEIETTVLNGKGGLTLTGQLGDVMQESAHAALSYIRSRADELGLKSSFYTTKDIHIHIPEGATPKDGPSAGITICTAVISALINKPIINDLAMTGEITLQGRVLAVGGLKEKLLAAKQHDIKTAIVPQENFDEIQEVLKEANLTDIKIVYASNMDEVLATAFPEPILKKVPSNSVKKETKKKPIAKAKPKTTNRKKTE
ncbi:Lon protease [Candidatus Dependentiae bacterium Noda2021]|nr:Lon protease [Candidatus Dependentiae bacterium Noda2021]